VKRSASATTRRTVRRAMTWRPKSAGRHDVDVASLISPLRYDVLVRAEFFTFLEQWGDRRLDDGDALVAAAGELPYATWFRSVAMARFRPWVLGDPVLLQQQFRERVLSALALWRSFRGRGFDPTHPVTLRWTAGPLRTDTGLMIDRRLHVGDGGHRLALLLSAGLPLSADLYRVDRRPQRTLIDNTAVLVPALGIADQEYVRFVARGYTGTEYRDATQLVLDVGRTDPARASEIASVVEHHRALLAGRS
jgi:hypothetical protein